MTIAKTCNPIAEAIIENRNDRKREGKVNAHEHADANKMEQIKHLK